MIPPLLDVRHLSVTYPSPAEPIRAVRDVSFQMEQGGVVALVGETGCGKSSVALSLLGLLDRKEQLESGSILFDGQELTALERAAWQQIRGRQIGMIFQDARSALNPVLTVGDHLLETQHAHQSLTRREARERAVQLLGEAGVPDPEFHMRRYPFELSGGMCQRVGIALGICNNPRLLIADEPTSALDPTLQLQVLNLLKEMNRRYGLALLLISHDLALVAEFADRVLVMYHGCLVESGFAKEIFSRPAHPYTRGLIESLPTLSHQRDSHRLSAIPGTPPVPGQTFPGCPFAPRCRLAEPRCGVAFPPSSSLSESHWAACIKPGPGA